jgi:hypothetical protein
VSDKPPYWLIAAVFLAACGPEGVVPQPVPIVLSYALKPGEEVECIETLTRVLLPGALPVFGWAKRTFNCEVRKKSTAVPERIMREK